jgi:hypothetical protein
LAVVAIGASVGWNEEIDVAPRQTPAQGRLPPEDAERSSGCKFRAIGASGDDWKAMLIFGSRAAPL